MQTNIRIAALFLCLLCASVTPSRGEDPAPIQVPLSGPLNVCAPTWTFNAGGVKVGFSQGQLREWALATGGVTFEASYLCSGIYGTNATIDFSEPVKNVRFRIVSYERVSVNYLPIMQTPGEAFVTIPGPTRWLYFQRQGPIGSWWGWAFYLDSISFEKADPEAQWALQAKDVSPATLPEIKKFDSAGSIHVTVPLGSVFAFRLNKMLGPVAVPAVGRFSLSDATIKRTLPKGALFSSQCLVEFDAASATEWKTFTAIHLGTQEIEIIPPGVAVPLTAVVEVTEPGSLGTATKHFDPHNELDSITIEIADTFGLPVDQLKGQMEKESHFNRFSWRYEPLSRWGDFGAVTGVALGTPGPDDNVRTQLPYSRYRMATVRDAINSALPAGVDLTDADVEPRNALRFTAPDGTVRLITNLDRNPISARDIYEQNDKKQNWSANNPKEASAVKVDPSLLDFTAQTTIASSYGLLQILYPTAIKPMYWKNAHASAKSTAVVNPLLLFDMDANIASRDSSMWLGGRYLARMYREHFGVVAYVDGGAWWSKWRTALNYYNHSSGDCKDNTCGSCYATCVQQNQKHYPIVSSGFFK